MLGGSAGLVVFETTNPPVDLDSEARLNRKMGVNGGFRFVIPIVPNHVTIISRNVDRLKVGDSVWVDTAIDLIRVNRQDSLVVEEKVSDALKQSFKVGV